MKTLQAICGVDEAGRGPWAGPVFAAAVILCPRRPVEGLADSKALSAARRRALANDIRISAIAWGVGLASVEEIDKLNIRRATHLAMVRAIAALGQAPALALIDGNDAPAGLPCPAETRIGGDASVPQISAASILAKTVRDAEMERLCTLYPGYGFARHKGYGTREHAEALGRLGPSAVHRRSFAPVRRLLGA